MYVPNSEIGVKKFRHETSQSEQAKQKHQFKRTKNLIILEIFTAREFVPLKLYN